MALEEVSFGLTLPHSISKILTSSARMINQWKLNETLKEEEARKMPK